MPGGKICQPGNPAGKSGDAAPCGRAIFIRVIMPSSYPDPEPRKAARPAGKFEIEPFIYIIT